MEQLVARRAHNPKVVGSSPAPATLVKSLVVSLKTFFVFDSWYTKGTTPKRGVHVPHLALSW